MEQRADRHSAMRLTHLLIDLFIAFTLFLADKFAAFIERSQKIVSDLLGRRV
jgi:hypothetical protein